MANNSVTVPFFLEIAKVTLNFLNKAQYLLQNELFFEDPISIVRGSTSEAVPWYHCKNFRISM
jgi:hypothetical protein